MTEGERNLVYEMAVEHETESYRIRVYSSDNGRYYAETPLSEDDIIINDASSLEEVLLKHAKLLPLAISARKIKMLPSSRFRRGH